MRLSSASGDSSVLESSCTNVHSGSVRGASLLAQLNHYF